MTKLIYDILTRPNQMSKLSGSSKISGPLKLLIVFIKMNIIIGDKDNKHI